MSYIKDMLEKEQDSLDGVSDNMAGVSGLQKIVLRANHHISKDEILALKGTKALKVETMCNTDNEYDNRQTWGELLVSAHGSKQYANVTTWSSLIRSTIEILRPTLNYVFSIAPDSDDICLTFKACLENVCERAGVRLNSNCPKRLFKESEELEIIKSPVYLNNKNHMIKVFTDEDGIGWYLCAVYTDEIVIMIETLLDTIYSIMEEYSNYQDRIKDFPHHTIVLSYVDRGSSEYTEEDTENVTQDGDTITIKRKDFVELLTFIELLSSGIEMHIKEIEKKYNITPIDNLNCLFGKNTTDELVKTMVNGINQ